MKNGCDKIYFLFLGIVFLLLAIIIFANSATGETNSSGWTYKGQSLEGILKNNSWLKEEKQLAIEKAILDGKIPKDELNKSLTEAVSLGIINEEQKKSYLEDKGLLGNLNLWAGHYYSVFKGFVGDSIWNLILVKLTWEHIIFILAVSFWYALFLPFSIYTEFKGERVNFYELYKKAYPTFSFFYRLKKIYKELLSENYYKIIILFLGYLILLVIPITGRIVQLITLEFLGAHWFWRALMVAGVISFVSVFFELIKGYISRTREYKEEMLKAAAEEAMKIQLKG